MTYDPLIPQATEIISVSQPKILENFTQLNALFGIDHVEFNNLIAANRGKHTKVTFVQQTGDPATPPTSTEIQMYTKNVGGTPRIFIRRLGVGNIYQLDGPNPSPAASGYTWLPGGLILQWGSQSATAGNPVSFPLTFTTAYQVIGSTNANDRALAITAINPGNFTFSVLNPNAAVTIRWMAIGTL